MAITSLAVAAVVPTVVLPHRLKSQPTDTEKRDAIQDLVSTLQDHVGAPWADNLLAGEFGQPASASTPAATPAPRPRR